MIELADPFTPFPIWQSAGYQPDPDPAPLYAHQWPDLLGQCRSALARRQASYPAMIARDAIPADLAERDLAAWALLTAEWLWIISGNGEAPAGHTLSGRIAAVELARLRVDQEIARGNRGFDVMRQCHLIDALHWHLTTHSHGEPMVHACARFNHDQRARQAVAFCPDCERWNFHAEHPACGDTPCAQIKDIAA